MPAVEDSAYAAPRRFPQSLKGVPLSALHTASYSGVTAPAFKRADREEQAARGRCRAIGRNRREIVR